MYCYCFKCETEFSIAYQKLRMYPFCPRCLNGLAFNITSAITIHVDAMHAGGIFYAASEDLTEK